jgi:hypothetical protein
VGRARVEDAGPLGAELVHDRRRFPRRLVRQAEHDEVDRGQEVALGLRVLAPVRVDGAQGDLRMGAQPLADAEAGGARLAVDEHGADGAGSHANPPGVKRTGGR